MSNPIHQEIRQLLANKVPRKEIALQLDINPNTLRGWIIRHQLQPEQTSTKTILNNEFVKGNYNAKELSKKYDISIQAVYQRKSLYLKDRDIKPQHVMTNKEIAEALSMSEKNVEKLARDALNKMRDYCTRNGIYDDLLEYLELESNKTETLGTNFPGNSNE